MRLGRTGHMGGGDVSSLDHIYGNKSLALLLALVSSESLSYPHSHSQQPRSSQQGAHATPCLASAISAEKMLRVQSSAPKFGVLQISQHHRQRNDPAETPRVCQVMGGETKSQERDDAPGLEGHSSQGRLRGA